MARRFPVLMYHGIAPLAVPAAGPDRKYWVTAASFRQQLEQIRHAGLRLGALRDLAESEVVLTFDDGRASDFEVALPILLQAGARAEFFVNTATIGQAGYLSWEQVREMQRLGMSFQSHAHDHVPLPTLAQPRLEHQLRTSKHRLEDRLTRPVEFLAAPYGLLDRRVIETAWAIGYRGVCNSRNWPATVGSRIINRVAIQSHTGGDQYAGLLSARPSAYLPGLARTALAYLPKRVLLKLRPNRLGAELAPERT